MTPEVTEGPQSNAFSLNSWLGISNAQEEETGRARAWQDLHMDQGHLHQQPQKRFALKGRKSTGWAPLALGEEAGMSSCHQQVCLRHLHLERLMWHFLKVVGVLTKWLQQENSPIHRPRQEGHLPLRVTDGQAQELIRDMAHPLPETFHHCPSS